MTQKIRKEPTLGTMPLRGQGPSIDDAAHCVVADLIASDPDTLSLQDFVKSTPLEGKDSRAFQIAEKQYKDLYQTLFDYTKEQMVAAEKVPAPEKTLETAAYNVALEQAIKEKPVASQEALEQEARYKMISAQNTFQNTFLATPTFGERFRGGMMSLAAGFKKARSFNQMMTSRMEPSDIAEVQSKKGFLSSFKDLKTKMVDRVSQMSSLVKDSFYKMDMSARNMLSKASPVLRAMPVVTLGISTGAILAASAHSLPGVHDLLTHFNHLGPNGFGTFGADTAFTNMADANTHSLLGNAGVKLASLSPHADVTHLSNNVATGAISNIADNLGVDQMHKQPFLEIAKLNDQQHLLDNLSQQQPSDVHLAALSQPEAVHLKTPDAVHMATPSPAPEVHLRTPDAVHLRTPDPAPEVHLRTPDAVHLRTPDPAPEVHLRTPDAVHLRTPDPAPEVHLRTPDAVHLRTPDPINPVTPEGHTPINPVHDTIHHGHTAGAHTHHTHVKPTTDDLNADAFEKVKVQAAVEHPGHTMSASEVSKAWADKHIPADTHSAPTQPVQDTPHQDTASIVSKHGAEPSTDVAPKPGVVHEASLSAPETSENQVKVMSHMTQENAHGVTGQASLKANDGHTYSINGHEVSDPSAQNEQKLSSDINKGLDYADRQAGMVVDKVSNIAEQTTKKIADFLHL